MLILDQMIDAVVKGRQPTIHTKTYICPLNILFLHTRYEKHLDHSTYVQQNHNRCECLSVLLLLSVQQQILVEVYRLYLVEW